MNATNERVEELKHVVEADWAGDETARVWRKYYPIMKTQLAEVTQALVDTADPKPGMSVLDLASGTGEPSLSIARRVAPVGRVIATDLSPAMLAVLRENATNEDVTNIDTKVEDAHELSFSDNSFDLVTSRFGVMFFVEIDRALGEIRRVLKPGGRAAFLVWGEPKPGTYFGTAVAPFMRRLDQKPDPDGPGPMRYAEPGKLKALVEAAGFREVNEQVASFDARWPGTPEELLASLLEIAAPLRTVVESMPADLREEATQETYANLRPYFDGTNTVLKAPAVIVTGIK
jgi:ubiquinone/menaquinone biosynthesis C-methylase UbiE